MAYTNFYQPVPNYSTNPAAGAKKTSNPFDTGFNFNNIGFNFNNAGAQSADPFAGSSVFDPFAGNQQMAGLASQPGEQRRAQSMLAQPQQAKPQTEDSTVAFLKAAQNQANANKSTASKYDFLQPLTNPNYNQVNVDPILATLGRDAANTFALGSLYQNNQMMGPSESAYLHALGMEGNAPGVGLSLHNLFQQGQVDRGQLTGSSHSGSAGAGGSFSQSDSQSAQNGDQSASKSSSSSGSAQGQASVAGSQSWSGQPWYQGQLDSGLAGLALYQQAVQAAQSESTLRAAQQQQQLQGNLALAEFLRQSDLQDQYLPQLTQLQDQILAMLTESTGGGSVIDAESPFSRERAQARANTAQATAEQRAASLQRQLADRLSGAGFGGNSPLNISGGANIGALGAFQGLFNAENIMSDYEESDANYRLAAQIAASEARNRDVQAALDLLRNQYSLVGALFG